MRKIILLVIASVVAVTAMAQLDLARALSNTQIVSPVDGFVVIMLALIVVSNASLLVDYTKHFAMLRQRALVRGSRSRRTHAVARIDASYIGVRCQRVYTLFEEDGKELRPGREPQHS